MKYFEKIIQFELFMLNSSTFKLHNYGQQDTYPVRLSWNLDMQIIFGTSLAVMELIAENISFLR